MWVLFAKIKCISEKPFKGTETTAISKKLETRAILLKLLSCSNMHESSGFLMLVL